MTKVTSREELKNYCLRRLGFPVIEINVDDDQIEDRIDDTFQIFFDYHYDGVERMFYVHKVTQTDLDNGWIPVPDSLISIIRALPFSGASGMYFPLGDPSLAWNSTSANPLFGSGPSSFGNTFKSGVSDHGGAGKNQFDKIGFYMKMAQLEEYEMLFSGEVPIRFSRHTNRVYLDTNMNEKVAVDSYIVFEGWAALDPEVYTDVYNDRWVKRYATAAIKQQWGANLIKYSGIQLPGGVTLDGDKLYEQATNELQQLEEELQLKYEEPVQFYLG